MALLRIRKFPEDVLKEPAAAVKNINGSVEGLIDSMVQTMYAAPGVGLAAPQVGESKRIIVLDTNHDDPGKHLLKLINPKDAVKGEWTLSDQGLALPKSEYVVNDTVVQEGDTYLLYWDLHPSSPAGMSAPKYVEGYFRTQPVGPHTLIVYCNYVIPVTGLFPGMVKRAGRKAMQTTLHDTVRWVDTIAAEPAASGQSIARLRAMLAR